MAMTGLLKRLSVMALAVAVVFSGLPMLAYAEGETLVPDSSRPASGVVEECAEEDGLQESGDDSPLKDDAAQGVPGEAMEDANESVSGTLGKGESSDGQTIAALGGGVEESASSVPPLERVGAQPGSRTVEDGIYTLACAGDPSLALDVVAGSSAPGANVTLWSDYGGPRQKFRVEYLGNGYYKMTALHSGQALDVVASGTASGTNVTQWTDVGADNQQWVVELLPHRLQMQRPAALGGRRGGGGLQRRGRLRGRRGAAGVETGIGASYRGRDVLHPKRA